MTDNQRIDILKIKEASQRARECGMAISEYIPFAVPSVPGSCPAVSLVAHI